jgi:two-component system KDP operon response regulator KdpE
VLVVDDEHGIRVYVGANLRKQGYDVRTVSSGAEALDAAALESPHLVILDLAMPPPDGFAVLARLREGSQVPVIVLSAHADQADKVRALDLGADDYLTKPFGVDELLARVRVALRRAGAAGEAGDATTRPDARPTVALGGPTNPTIDLARRVVAVGGAEVHLTRTEFDLLAYLAGQLDRVVGQRELLQRVWGPEYGTESEYLRTFVRQLRKKIEPVPAEPRYLHTVSGVGYRLTTARALHTDTV